MVVSLKGQFCGVAKVWLLVVLSGNWSALDTNNILMISANTNLNQVSHSIYQKLVTQIEKYKLADILCINRKIKFLKVLKQFHIYDNTEQRVLIMTLMMIPIIYILLQHWPQHNRATQYEYISLLVNHKDTTTTHLPKCAILPYIIPGNFSKYFFILYVYYYDDLCNSRIY